MGIEQERAGRSRGFQLREDERVADGLEDLGGEPSGVEAPLQELGFALMLALSAATSGMERASTSSRHQGGLVGARVDLGGLRRIGR